MFSFTSTCTSYCGISIFEEILKLDFKCTITTLFLYDFVNIENKKIVFLTFKCKIAYKIYEAKDILCRIDQISNSGKK